MPHPSDKSKQKPGPVRLKTFVPYGTMYKIDGPFSSQLEFDTGPRGLVCVSCYVLVEWSTYRIAPKVFDKRCPTCKVDAKDFWRGKVHKELKVDG